MESRNNIYIYMYKIRTSLSIFYVIDLHLLV